jgi:GT2 family glycosyltransferase
MADPPLVAVILVNWNGKDLTADCLSSLRRVTYTNFRVLVVDNASSDGSVTALQRSYPEVDILPLPSNRRFAGGNNAGIARALAAEAEFIVLLNNDTIADPEFLTMLVEAFQSDPRAGMIAPKILYHDHPDRLWYAGGEISFWRGTMHHIGIRETDAGQHDVRRETGYATGCCLLTSRTVIRQIGLLDESYFMYGEDADWCMRARNAGYRILYEPRARVWHKVSVSAGGHLSRFKLTQKFISGFRFFARYSRWYHWLVFPWLSIVANGVAAVRYLIRPGTP